MKKWEPPNDNDRIQIQRNSMKEDYDLLQKVIKTIYQKNRPPHKQSWYTIKEEREVYNITDKAWKDLLYMKCKYQQDNGEY